MERTFLCGFYIVLLLNNQNIGRPNGRPFLLTKQGVNRLKWFEETFLQSIFNRAGVNRAMWLSRKQTAICTENMVPSSWKDNEGFRHIVYTTVYKGRKVTMQYSKKNGCGQIIFEATEEEEKMKKEAMQEYRKKCIERAKHSAKVTLERHPERVPGRLVKLQIQIESVLFALEDETNPDLIANLKQTLAECEAAYTVLMNG